MKTPICDFVKAYAKSDAVRLHMPGHKGQTLIGPEKLDITEIDGADVLYQADGIIAQSEQNAASLFGTAKTLYSAEGSSLAIRAMLYLAVQYAAVRGISPRILAGRNAHKTFITSAALLDIEVSWLYGEADSLLSCRVTADSLEAALKNAEETPAAVYITSPDYLGNMVDIAALSAVCRKYGVLLLVDNAHGAYLRFLAEDLHPITLGADICCDSAHKTLPSLTGGAYLHISKAAPLSLSEQAPRAMALFASTSPSYLILQSLDALNCYLANGYPERLQSFTKSVAACKQRLSNHGFVLIGNETLKITVASKPYGYTGYDLAEILAKCGIVCEFADPDYLVLMLTPELGEECLTALTEALISVPQKTAITEPAPIIEPLIAATSMREAMLSPNETLPVDACLGRVLADPSVSCPPAVPIAVYGEQISDGAVRLFHYYGVSECRVRLLEIK